MALFGITLFGHDLHALTGAYALDALDEGREKERFIRHLHRCQSCTAETRGLREVATQLAFAASAEPPAGLRERVLAVAAVTRQLPPVVAGKVRRRWLRGWLSGIPWTIWMPRLASVTAVAAVAAAVVLGIVLSGTDSQLNSQRSQNQAIAAVLGAPDVRAASGAVSTGGRATVVLSGSKRELVVSTSGLAALPAGKVYQLWLIGPKVTMSAGLVPAAVAGKTTPVLASGLVKGDVLGLTVEPAGGTKQPTTTPILLLKLPAE
jgi:hypothetical protein